MYWVIVDQLLRAATSIGANIIESKAASSKKDLLSFTKFP
jgi:four helix bundle protein